MKQLFCLLVIFLSMNAGVRADEGGVGTRGGGETIDLNGHPALRDLHDQTVCEWKRLSDYASGSEALARLLARIEKKHPYLVYQYQKMFQGLYLCFTEGTLNPIPSDDLKILAAYSVKRQQVAIRLNSQIFIDQKIYRQLPKDEQALLILHEVSHPLINPKASGRTAKLRSFIQMLSKIDSLSDSEILANLKANDVFCGWIDTQSWPIVLKLLDPAVSDLERGKVLRKIFHANPLLYERNDCIYFAPSRKLLETAMAEVEVCTSLIFLPSAIIILNAEDIEEIRLLFLAIQCRPVR